jgi:ribosomal protein S18 acetylase RimI-like enzyme
MDYEIILVTEENLDDHPQAVCFTKKGNPEFKQKQKWLKEQFKKGLRLKLLYPADSQKCVGYIEYTEGKSVWRSVSAAGFLFIHCIWVTPNKYKNQGLASILLDDCYQDAVKNGYSGVAVLCSGDSFLAKRDLFCKNGYEVCDSIPPKFELLVKQGKDSAKPHFNIISPEELNSYKGLNVVYSEQCPWVIRSVTEIEGLCRDLGVPLKIKKLGEPEEAQNAPSLYSVFTMIYNGKILADHYVSLTRVKNILKKAIPGA